MNRYFTNRLAARVTLALGACFSFASFCHYASAARMPGAPRALTVRFPDDAPVTIESSLTQAAVGPLARNAADDAPATYPLYFTRTSTTRNIYRADLKVSRKPMPQTDAIEGEDGRSSALNGDTRFVTTVAPVAAAPLTRLAAPMWAENGVPTQDGRTVLCVTNALASTRDRASGFDQIARIDVRSGAMRALTPADTHYRTPVISPDGRAIAYSCDRSGTEDVYVGSLDLGSSGNVRAQRVARLVRRPVWVDNDALVVENLLPGSTGLARVNLREATKSSAAARKLWNRGGQAAFDGRLLCVAAPILSKDNPNDDADPETQLYLLSSDGSGARALTGTSGANEPLFAPDGSFLLFDAPSVTASPAEKARGLWMIPMRRVAPVARLDRVRPLSGDTLAVIGTAFSNDNAPVAIVEWGEGRSPDRWTSLPTAVPVHSSMLARWTPPSQRGEWTLRLRVADAEGDTSESLLPVSLPSVTAPPVVAPPIFANPPTNPPGAPPAAAPVAPAQPVFPTPFPTTVLPAERAPESANPPRLAAGPPPVHNPAPVHKRPIVRPTPHPAPKPTPPAPTPAPPAAPSTPTAVAGDAAVLTVTGIPYSVAPGETINMSASMRNTGRTGWRVSGDGAVRLLVRWHDAKTRGRTRWAVRWIRAEVPPGGTGKIEFSIPAPTKIGDYILRFSLVRVGPDGYTPPPYSQSASDRYPGEFGIATTTMPVRPQ